MVIGQPARKGLSPSFDEAFGAGVDDHQRITQAAATGRFDSDMENVSVEEPGVLPRVAAQRAAEVGLGRSLEGFKMQKVREVLLVFEPCTWKYIVISTRNFKCWLVQNRYSRIALETL